MDTLSHLNLIKELEQFDPSAKTISQKKTRRASIFQQQEKEEQEKESESETHSESEEEQNQNSFGDTISQLSSLAEGLNLRYFLSSTEQQEEKVAQENEENEENNQVDEGEDGEGESKEENNDTEEGNENEDDTEEFVADEMSSLRSLLVSEDLLEKLTN